MLRRHAFKAVIVAGILLALVGFATRADAARSWASVPPAHTPIPASPTRVGTVAKLADHPDGFTRVVAAVHVETDAQGNTTLRAAGAVASYDRRQRAVSRPLALRVTAVGDKTGLRKAFPLETGRRTRRGPARIAERMQARVLAYEYRGGKWRKYLVTSKVVYLR